MREKLRSLTPLQGAGYGYFAYIVAVSACDLFRPISGIHDDLFAIRLPQLWIMPIFVILGDFNADTELVYITIAFLILVVAGGAMGLFAQRMRKP